MPPKAKKRQTAEGRENIRQRIASEKRDLLDKNTKLQLKYAQASLRLPPYRPGPAPNAPEIKSNFFKITLLKDPKTNAPGPTLQKYKIILGDVNGFELTNRKTRKYLIEELLQKNPPTHGSRISDYFNYIISVRKIYEKYDDDPKEAFETPHLRTGPGGSVIGVTSRVQFDGYVNKDELLKMVNNQRTPNYQPDADLMALNVVSWLRVRSKEFSGGLIGKKFYPEKTELSKPIGFRTRKGVDWKPENRFPYGKPLYELKSGFFSSVWLGTKNLLLNVNVTTSAFYANVSVQDWIITRCSEDNDKANCKISDDEAAGELVGLKVTLKGDTEPKREYRILEVYKATVSTCTVEKEDGTQPSVYDDLIAGKFRSSVDSWMIRNLVPILGGR
jgi:hypothetical protein